jgi:hypothetical protein
MERGFAPRCRNSRDPSAGPPSNGSLDARWFRLGLLSNGSLDARWFRLGPLSNGSLDARWFRLGPLQTDHGTCRRPMGRSSFPRCRDNAPSPTVGTMLLPPLSGQCSFPHCRDNAPSPTVGTTQGDLSLVAGEPGSLRGRGASDLRSGRVWKRARPGRRSRAGGRAGLTVVNVLGLGKGWSGSDSEG